MSRPPITPPALFCSTQPICVGIPTLVMQIHLPFAAFDLTARVPSRLRLLPMPRPNDPGMESPVVLSLSIALTVDF